MFFLTSHFVSLAKEKKIFPKKKFKLIFFFLCHLQILIIQPLLACEGKYSVKSH